jgi:prepilin peptidase CpaA
MIFAEAAFVLILMAAAASDVMYYRIPNVLVLALAGAFVVWAIFAHVAWLGHLSAALLCLAGGVVFYVLGQMGAGDVKLLTAVALWVGLSGLLALLVFVSLGGLIVLPLLLLARVLVVRAQTMNLWRAEWPIPRVLAKKQGVPYGVAIALGGIVTMAFHPDSFG